MTNPLRIAFVCHEYPPAPHGGIGVFVQLFARGLAALGHDVRVIGVYRREYANDAAETDRGVRVWRFAEPAVRGGWLAARVRLFRQIARWVRNGEVTLIEVPDWQGSAARWPRLAAPVVVRLHGSETYFAVEMRKTPRRLTVWCERASLRRADFWCSVSRYTAERTAALFALRDGPDAILPNPVEAAGCGGGATLDMRRDVLFSGTLTAKKGIVSLIDAWDAVRQRHPKTRLHVFGKDGRTSDGLSMRAFLTARLSPHVRDSVLFHGHTDRSTLLSRLCEARVAVFPSYAEACAIAPLEAMACGCPTISTRRGSGPELLEDGVHGLLVDPDDVPGVAAAISRLLEDDGLAQRLGRAGREHVRSRFSTASLLDENVRFFRECLDRFRFRGTEASQEPGRFTASSVGRVRAGVRGR